MDIPAKNKLHLLHVLNAIYAEPADRWEMERKVNDLNFTQFIEWVKNSDRWISWADHELDGVNKAIDDYRDKLLSEALPGEAEGKLDNE